MFEAEMSKPRAKPRDPNHILAALPAGDYRRIASKIEPFSFRRGQLLYEPDRPISHVYFPRTGVASIVTRLAEGGTIEIATVGNEGMVGLPAYLGNGSSAMEVMVQISGDAARMSTRTFRQEIRAIASLRDVIRRYTQARMTQLGQSAACNRVHSIVERCSRWLLASHDRVPGDRFHLTQEFLAEMLGVRRATVTQVAGALKRRGLIDYRRGMIRILDRKGLEKTACECYRLIRSEHQRLVG
jgi:CRP-like cAMP-binding protein